MIYCDTSFLLALYIETEPGHNLALQTAATFKEAIAFTLLVELELINGVRRGLTTRTINRQQHDAVFRQIPEDEADDILVRCALDQTEHYARARKLSKKFTPEIAARSLDILHVAAALLLKTGEFASFDEKQQILAEKAGLKPIPKIIARKKGRKV
jgi:predicted nucleic acid-binding protein